MPFCSECGSPNDDDSKFCGNCGMRMASTSNHLHNLSSSYQASVSPAAAPQYQPPQSTASMQFQEGVLPRDIPKPTSLQVVIILYWIGFGLLILGDILLVFFYFPLAILTGLLTWLFYWVAKGLTVLNPNARSVALILVILGFIIDLVSGGFPLMSLVIGGFIVYTLEFDANVKEMFEPNYSV